MEWLPLALLLTCLPSQSQVEAAHYDNESMLRKDLLEKNEYKPAIRPSRQVTIKAMLSLLNINDLDVPTQRLSVSGWLSFTWQDPRLTWNPVEYDGIKDLFDTEDVFWRPEIIVDNSVSNLGILESDKLLIRASYNGNMKWEPPGIFETHCNVDVTFYPFDTQICVVEVTSWAQTVDEIDLYPNGTNIDLTDYQESGEWNVLDTWTDRRLLRDGVEIHSEITFSVKLQRKPLYYITTILIPVIVTSILCIVVFLLPAEAGEKVGYSLTILLTYTVMLTLVASYMPPTSKHTSVLSVYLTIILFIGMFTTIITVVVLHLHHKREDKKIPKWIQFVTRNIMVPISRWRPRQRPKSADVISEDFANNLSRNMYHINQIHPESRRPANMTYRHSSNERSKNIVTPLGNQRHIVHYINRHGKQRDEHFVRCINEQRNGFENTFGHEIGIEASFGSQCSNKEYHFTWHEVGVILDAFCLRILGGFVLVLTLIVLLTMIIKG